MGETVMGLLYAIFSIFITLFFPKQITDVICYGRHRDREKGIQSFLGSLLFRVFR